MRIGVPNPPTRLVGITSDSAETNARLMEEINGQQIGEEID